MPADALHTSVVSHERALGIVYSRQAVLILLQHFIASKTRLPDSPSVSSAPFFTSFLRLMEYTRIFFGSAALAEIARSPVLDDDQSIVGQSTVTNCFHALEECIRLILIEEASSLGSALSFDSCLLRNISCFLVFCSDHLFIKLLPLTPNAFSLFVHYPARLLPKRYRHCFCWPIQFMVHLGKVMRIRVTIRCRVVFPPISCFFIGLSDIHADLDRSFNHKNVSVGGRCSAG